MRNQDQLNRVVRDFLDGRLTARQRKEFLQWVRQSNKSADMEWVYQSIFEQIDGLSEQELTTLQQLLRRESKSQGILRRIRPLVKYAAALVLLCGVYVVYQWIISAAEEPKRALTAGQGNTSSTQQLPDGSEITLYGSSRFEVVEYDGKSRTVLLHGEADFAVVPSKVPFFVKTEAGYFTKVLGTKFSVHDTAGNYRVVVERGRVSVGKGDDILGVLTKGDSLTAAGDQIRVYSNVINPLMFDGVKLKQVLHTINQNYDAEIELSNGLDGDVKCTAAFEKYLSVTEIVEVLCEMYGYTYAIEGQRIIIQSS